MGQIDLALAKQMVSNYATTRKKLIDSTYGTNDTASIWFSASEVLNLVKDLTPSVTGVRIYLGAYDENYPATPNQTTIIAIGTVKNSAGNDVDAIGGGLEEDLADPPPHNNGKICPPIC